MLVRPAILRSFDASSYTAAVQLPGSISANLAGVPVSRAIPSGEMVAGRRVALLIFDQGNPGDCVLTAVWT